MFVYARFVHAGLRCSLPAAALLCGACATTSDGVPPHQGGYLDQREMAWDAGLAQEGAARTQTFNSKEAASGGAALGSGGCGCN